MNKNSEKRTHERQGFSAPIVFSYFNKEQRFEAQTLNHCDGGLCFKSDICLKPGATVYIKVKKFSHNGPCNSNCEGLRSVTLAEIKWSRGIPDPMVHSYETGVNYYELPY
jgi:hypothetical protein